MIQTEIEFRAGLVQEALSWRGTPYSRGHRVKGAGADCATFLYMCLFNCGLIAQEDIGVFADDWYLHASEDIYMQRILRHAYKTAQSVCYRSLEAKPGCLVLTKAVGSAIYNHGGLVLRWPTIAHAIAPAVEVTDASRHPLWAYQEITVFDPYPKAVEAC